MQLLVSMHVCVQDIGHTLFAVSVLCAHLPASEIIFIDKQRMILNKVDRIEEVNVYFYWSVILHRMLS